MKVSSKERKEKKERAKKWRPSTGEFKTPPGGMSPASATPRRSKARMRGIKGGPKTGLSRSHLAVEMSHRGVKTKQPTSKDPKEVQTVPRSAGKQEETGQCQDNAFHASTFRRSFLQGWQDWWWYATRDDAG